VDPQPTFDAVVLLKPVFLLHFATGWSSHNREPTHVCLDCAHQEAFQLAPQKTTDQTLSLDDVDARPSRDKN
jgi:hypothetical protein